jgi:hypothetical protein
MLKCSPRVTHPICTSGEKQLLLHENMSINQVSYIFFESVSQLFFIKNFAPYKKLILPKINNSQTGYPPQQIQQTAKQPTQPLQSRGRLIPIRATPPVTIPVRFAARGHPPAADDHPARGWNVAISLRKDILQEHLVRQASEPRP